MSQHSTILLSVHTCYVWSSFFKAKIVTSKHVKMQHCITNCSCLLGLQFILQDQNRHMQAHQNTALYITIHYCQVCSLFFKAKAITSKHIETQHYVTNCTYLLSLQFILQGQKHHKQIRHNAGLSYYLYILAEFVFYSSMPKQSQASTLKHSNM